MLLPPSPSRRLLCYLGIFLMNTHPIHAVVSELLQWHPKFQAFTHEHVQLAMADDDSDGLCGRLDALVGFGTADRGRNYGATFAYGSTPAHARDRESRRSYATRRQKTTAGQGSFTSLKFRSDNLTSKP
ncbi:hypothetical protein C8Q73DRAFT_159532 [Cubamyces lactineus]|nr:hypothetical protein C8Q73DRAFT_159532 [Cubamyces lactineus]